MSVDKDRVCTLEREKREWKGCSGNQWGRFIYIDTFFLVFFFSQSASATTDSLERR